jgi:hypothetical protein
MVRGVVIGGKTMNKDSNSVWRENLVGIALVLGAGIGVTVGVILGMSGVVFEGGSGIALGAVIGAAVGIIAGAIARNLYQNRG